MGLWIPVSKLNEGRSNNNNYENVRAAANAWIILLLKKYMSSYGASVRLSFQALSRIKTALATSRKKNYKPLHDLIQFQSAQKIESIYDIYWIWIMIEMKIWMIPTDENKFRDFFSFK